MSHQQNHPPAFTWDPTQFSGGTLVGLIDFENNAKITSSGGLISAMADSVSAASFVQATGANKPTLLTSAVTGRQVASFDGVNDQLTIASIPTGWPTGANAGGIFLVVNQTDAALSVTRNAIAYGGNANTTNRQISKTGVSSVIARGIVGDGSVARSVSSVSSFLGRGVVLVEIGATASSLMLNGVAEDATVVTTIPATGTTRACIGCNSGNSPASFWLGEISAIGVYTGTLSAQDKNLLHIWARIRLGV